MAQGAGLRVRLAVEWLACASRADRGEVRRVEGGRVRWEEGRRDEGGYGGRGSAEETTSEEE